MIRGGEGEVFLPDDGALAFPLDDLAVDYEPDSSPPPEIIAECDAVFAETGVLSESARRDRRIYEYRPQQREMARAVAGALAAGENLCVEAPTGVGKSFAYLVPLIYRSRIRGVQGGVGQGAQELSVSPPFFVAFRC